MTGHRSRYLALWVALRAAQIFLHPVGAFFTCLRAAHNSIKAQPQVLSVAVHDCDTGGGGCASRTSTRSCKASKST